MCNQIHFVFILLEMMSLKQHVYIVSVRLDDLYEKTQLECQADKITPLVTNPGRVMLTSSRLYFQPFNNVERVSILVHYSVYAFIFQASKI